MAALGHALYIVALVALVGIPVAVVWWLFVNWLFDMFGC